MNMCNNMRIELLKAEGGLWRSCPWSACRGRDPQASTRIRRKWVTGGGGSGGQEPPDLPPEAEGGWTGRRGGEGRRA